jgi:hypothetical protein
LANGAYSVADGGRLDSRIFCMPVTKEYNGGIVSDRDEVGLFRSGNVRPVGEAPGSKLYRVISRVVTEQQRADWSADGRRELSGGETRKLIRAHEADVRGTARDDWDAFALACGGLIRSTNAYTSLWQLRQVFRSRAKRFEVFAGEIGEEAKIAQCAIGVARRGAAIFLDRVAILPGFQDCWADVMAAILECCAAGSYRYEVEMNPDAPYEAQIASIPGVTINTVTSLAVRAVDLPTNIVTFSYRPLSK